ncbi:conserved protein of unknown function（Protein of unknown function DUF952,10-100&|uniref:DUF952 domain-containing protein n=1 Tax=Magnetospirillum sp. XM-1 TaxID=1663591 RepID=UPI00073DD95C|nr:DUF952 domain-containing protein [Magnetospirillum sp. XM-1]CUW38540.1 conserved protein of unknown function\
MSTPHTIYHVCRRTEWQYAQTTGVYGGSSQDAADGFIHFSGPDQVRASVAKHRAGQDDLVIVAVDPQLLSDALRWEVSRGGQLFPHLYGPLPLSAVKWVSDLTLGADGVHVFPAIED